MVLIVLIGALIGVSLPFLFARFDLDPATASGPLVTSIADVTGVLAYSASPRRCSASAERAGHLPQTSSSPTHSQPFLRKPPVEECANRQDDAKHGVVAEASA